jgi:hypothetical protein
MKENATKFNSIPPYEKKENMHKEKACPLLSQKLVCIIILHSALFVLLSYLPYK